MKKTSKQISVEREKQAAKVATAADALKAEKEKLNRLDDECKSALQAELKAEKEKADKIAKEANDKAAQKAKEQKKLDLKAEEKTK